jgi:UDP-glucose 4-epimerase
MLEACRYKEVDRFVFASSCAPLGRQLPPITEDKVPLPISPYGASKLAGEGYCLAYHGSWALGTTVLRFANVYGPYSAHKNSVVAKFCKDILTTGQITVDGDGQQTRDFVYVDDLCQAICLALRSELGGEVLQIASGTETSIIELTTMVGEQSGKKSEVRYGPPRQGDVHKSYASIAKAQRLLGWSPSTELTAGLRRTWDWFRSQSPLAR